MGFLAVAAGDHSDPHPLPQPPGALSSQDYNTREAFLQTWWEGLGFQSSPGKLSEEHVIVEFTPALEYENLSLI